MVDRGPEKRLAFPERLFHLLAFGNIGDDETRMPIRINSLTLGSTNASGRDLTLTLKLSLLYLADEDTT